MTLSITYLFILTNLMQNGTLSLMIVIKGGKTLDTQSQVKGNGLSSSEKALFLGCFYTFFVNGGLALILGAILPFMKDTYNLNYQLTGLLISMHSIGNLISSFLGGVLPVYLGKKKSIILFCSFGVIAFLLMISTGNPIVLLIAFLFTGLNRGAVSNFNNTVINDIATGQAWALNLLHSVFAIGAFISPFIALFFTRNNPNGWIYAALVLAFMCLIEIIVYSTMKIPNPNPVKREGKVKSDWGFLKNKYYLVACGILFSYLCAEQAINGWLVTYLKESGILSGTFAQSMASLLWIVILVGRLTSAYLSSKIKKSKLLLVSSLGYLAFFILLLSGRTLTPVAIGIVGVGFCMAGLYPTTIASIGGIVKQYPLALSFLLTFAGLGSILMPAIIGAVAEVVGIIGGMSVIIVAVVITLLFIMYNAYIYRNANEL